MELEATTLVEHYDRIYRYVLSLVHDPAEAEDLTQETFVRAHRRHETLRDDAAELSWLYRIATHVTVDRMRHQHRRPETDATVDPESVAAAEPSPARLQPEREEMSVCVQDHLVRLSEDYRAVLKLHDVQGLTAAETAAMLGDSVGSVKIRLHRARGKLRTSLEQGCDFSQDEVGTLVCDPKGS